MLLLSRAATVKTCHQTQTPWSGTGLLIDVQKQRTANKRGERKKKRGEREREGKKGEKLDHQAQTDDYSARQSAQALILKTAAAAA